MYKRIEVRKPNEIKGFLRYKKLDRLLSLGYLRYAEQNKMDNRGDFCVKIIIVKSEEKKQK